MKVPFFNLNLAYQRYQKEYDAAYTRVMERGLFVLGPEVERFEKNFAKLLNTKSCVGVANGTDAIELGLRALGIGSGMEVITTPLTATPTVMGILATGASVVFADVLRHNGLIAPEAIRKVITKKTAAIVVVHLYGQTCDMASVVNIAREYKLKVLEDCAQAHGSQLNNVLAGNFGDIAAWSFYPTKNLGSFGDAGALTSKSQSLIKKISAMRNYGQTSKNVHSYWGRNSRLDELQAAFLNVKIKYLKNEIKRRRSIAHYYWEELHDKIEIISTPSLEVLQSSSHHLFVICMPKGRDAFRARLAKQSIATLIHYPTPIHRQPFFINEKGVDAKQKFPQSEYLSKNIASLPLNPYLSDAEVEMVSRSVLKYL